MSDIPSDAPQASAAAAIAAALLRAAAASSGHRRLLFQGYLGVTPTEIMAELIPAATVTAHIGGQELAAIPVGTATVVPYLVAPPGTPPRPNAGSQGFA